MTALILFFFLLAFSVFAVFGYKILFELKKLNIELRKLDIENKLCNHRSEMKNFHTSHYDNFVDILPTKRFVSEILSERQEFLNHVKSLSEENREKRYQRLEKAFSVPTIKKEYKEGVNV